MATTSVIASPPLTTIDEEYGSVVQRFLQRSGRTVVNSTFAKINIPLVWVHDDTRTSKCHFANCKVLMLGYNGHSCVFANDVELVTHYSKEHVFMLPRCEVSTKLLRRYLMYFDHIFLPEARCGTTFGVPSEDMLALVEQGHASMPKIDVDDGQYLGDKFFLLQTRMFDTIDRAKPGSALVGQSSDSALYLPLLGDRNCRTLEIALFNSLPVPDDTTPLQDIVKFREKNYHLLQDLHHHLDKCAEEISTSPDSKRRLFLIKRDIERQVQHIVERTAMSSIRTYLTGMSLQYTLPPALAADLALRNLWDLFGVDLDLGPGLAGGLTISMVLSHRVHQRQQEQSRAFAYVDRAKGAFRRLE